MEKLIYLDTNIYLDYLENRTDKLRPLGEFAFQLIKRAIECEFKIIISGLIIKELINNINENRIKELFKSLKKNNKIIKTELIKEDKINAIKIQKERKTSFNDTLHAIIANRLKANYLVTRNIKHFYKLNDLVKIILPENL